MVAEATPDLDRAIAGREVVHMKDARSAARFGLTPGWSYRETQVMNRPQVA
jgi:hypothetical protein